MPKSQYVGRLFVFRLELECMRWFYKCLVFFCQPIVMNEKAVCETAMCNQALSCATYRHT